MRPACNPLRRLSRLPNSRVRLSHIRNRRGLAGTTQQPDIYDVVIVGGGPAGLGLATALRSSRATSSLRVALIESQDIHKTAQAHRDASPTAYSNRCSSLTPASVNFLTEIGAWQRIDPSRVQPYHHMSVWDGITGQQIHFDHATAHGLPFVPPPVPNQVNGKTIATMTENNNITTALLDTLDASAASSATILFPSTKVSSIDLGTDDGNFDLSSWPILTLSSGNTLAARLLVGADGLNSPVRTFAGIKTHGWDYERHGVVATLKLDSVPDAATAYQRFLPTGPVALLPLPDGFATLVWSTTPQNAGVLKSLNAEDFTAMVNAAFRLSHVDLEYMHTITAGQADELSWREQHTPIDNALVPGKVSQGESGVQAGSVASFPLKMRHAATYTGERIALVGDAAHTVHPLAGQGLNLGLADVQSLARVISDLTERGGDIGSTLSLEPYGADRYGKNHVMLGVCDKLHKLYSWQSRPIVAARSLGLGLVERWGGLKGTIMGAAG